MNLLGVLINTYTLIVYGIYSPIDGPEVWEDSAVYDLAFNICYTIGTCG